MNVLLFKPGAIGDMLQLSPVVRAIKERLPEARIALMTGDAASADLFAHNPLVDEVLIFDRKGEHRSWRAFLNQHLRWNMGAFYHQDPGTRWPYRFIVLFLAASVLAIPACPFLPQLAALPAASFIAVGLMGFLAGVVCHPARPSYLLRLVPYTLFFMGFYTLVTIMSMLKLTPEWKGRKIRDSAGASPPPAHPV